MENKTTLTSSLSSQLTSVKPMDFENYVCEKCGNKFFVEKIITKKVPNLYQGIYNTDLIDFRVMVCDSCGEIHEVFKHEPFFVKMMEE